LTSGDKNFNDFPEKKLTIISFKIGRSARLDNNALNYRSLRSMGVCERGHKHLAYTDL